MMITQKSGWLKRSLSVLLALVMCMSMISVTAFAEDTSEQAKEESGESINWGRLYGEAGTSTLAATRDSINDGILLSDDKYAFAGAFDGGKSEYEGAHGKTDAMFLLCSADGEVLKRTLTGGTLNDYYYGLTELPYGGFAAVGAAQSAVSYDGMVSIFDGEGNLVKSVTVGGDSKDELRAVTNTLDGGVVAVGYTQSKGGDIASTGKDSTNRDALIVKMNAELNIEWIHTYGAPGTATDGMDDFYAVQVCNDGGFIAVGQLGEEEGSLGGNDICAVRYSENGELLWAKRYGGSKDDVAGDIAVSPYKTVNRGEDPDDPSKGWDVEIVETGFAVVGTTASSDGIFSGSQTEADVKKAFFMKLDPDGEIESVDLMESSEGSAGNSVLGIPGGYLVGGTFEKNDMRFTGLKAHGKTDGCTAMYSLLGNFLGAASFGGADDDTLKGVLAGCRNDMLVYGDTKSSEFYGNALSGRYDGFVISASESMMTDYPEEKYILPVSAIKENEDTPSMMSPLLYSDAYAEKTGEQYQVTVYFVNAMIMGTQIHESVCR